MKLTILTWLWSQPGGRTKYTAAHVNQWAAMVRRHTTIDYELACVTDTPEGINKSIRIIKPTGDFANITIPTWSGGLPNCLRRIALFRPDAADIFGDRFVSMDVDCVVSGCLDPLFLRTEDFVMYQGTNFDRPYNGSMLLLTAGARPFVFTKFTVEGATKAGERFIGSDQAWISYALGSQEAIWSAEHGVAWYGSRYNQNNIRLMFFPGYPKPWDLVLDFGWISDHYRGDEGGRCIVVSDGPAVWEEFSKALHSGPIHGIISAMQDDSILPNAINVKNILHGERLAYSLGFSEIIRCGFTP